MANLELHLRITGLLLTLLAVLHIAFPRYFGWRKELAHLSLITRQILYVHTFFVALVVLLMGVLCLTSTADMVETRLGQRLCLGFSVFWLARLAIQHFGYSASLWKGKRFETGVHIVFTLMWLYFSGVFLAVYLGIGSFSSLNSA